MLIFCYQSPKLEIKIKTKGSNMPKIPMTKPTTRAPRVAVRAHRAKIATRTPRTPRVSVLMSAYNSEKYIAAAIESILTQTFTDFEFVIINDGSTDRTPEIVAEYAARDKRIKFIDNKKNAGLIAALNQGLEFCHGEYIARMDSDDISLPTRFAKQVKYMNQHPECGVCGAWIKKFGRGVKSDEFFKYQSRMKLLDFLIYGCQVAQPCTMIRKSILDKYNIKYNPDYKYSEDYAFWVQVCKHAEIHNLQEVLLNYRWHDGNVSVTHKKTQLECAERIRKSILSELLSNDADIEKLLRMTREVHERFWLFGLFPIIRRKQYSIVKTKFYLFEKIPLIKEKDGKIYLFEFIKIGILK